MTDLIYPSVKPKALLTKAEQEYTNVWRHRCAVLASYHNMMQLAENMMSSALVNSRCSTEQTKKFYCSLSIAIMALNEGVPPDELVIAGEIITKSTLNLPLDTVIKIYDVLQSCFSCAKYISSATNEYNLALSNKLSIHQILGYNQFVYMQLLEALAILKDYAEHRGEYDF